MQQATLISDNEELNGELVEIVDPRWKPGWALCTIAGMKVVFLWPVSKLKHEQQPDNPYQQILAGFHAQNKT